MTQTTTNTTAAKVAFKDATPEEQAARIKAQNERYIKMGTDRGLKDVKWTHAYLRAAKVQDDSLVAKTGAHGKKYLFVFYDNQLEGMRVPHTLFLNEWTYADGMIKRYDAIVNQKAHDKDHKMTVTVVWGKNDRGFDQMAAIFVDPNKKTVVAPAIAPKAPAKAQKPAPKAPAMPEVTTDDLPF